MVAQLSQRMLCINVCWIWLVDTGKETGIMCFLCLAFILIWKSLLYGCTKRIPFTIIALSFGLKASKLFGKNFNSCQIFLCKRLWFLVGTNKNSACIKWNWPRDFGQKGENVKKKLRRREQWQRRQPRRQWQTMDEFQSQILG